MVLSACGTRPTSGQRSGDRAGSPALCTCWWRHPPICKPGAHRARFKAWPHTRAWWCEKQRGPPHSVFDHWRLQRAGEVGLQRVPVQGPLGSNSSEVVRDWCLSGHGIMLCRWWGIAAQLASGALVRVLPAPCHARRRRPLAGALPRSGSPAHPAPGGLSGSAPVH